MQLGVTFKYISMNNFYFHRMEKWFHMSIVSTFSCFFDRLDRDIQHLYMYVALSSHAALSF